MSELYRICRPPAKRILYGAFFAGLLLANAASARFLEEREASRWPHVMRSATVATATMGTTFLDSDNLGNHTYIPDGSERTGIIYTCRGGHIDIAHLRKAADWTANIAYRTRRNLLEGNTQFKFKLYEPSVYHVTLAYPVNWRQLSDRRREEICHEVSIALAQHFAFTALTWHEVLTWFGYKTLGVLSEFESAFSWEDTFSNVLGTRLAVRALRDPDRSFSDAMTVLLDQEVARLGGQSGKVSRKASNEVRGLWWSYNLIFLSMKKRNFDIGLDDGYITPWLVPSIAQCRDARPVSCPIPSLDVLDRYGFVMKLEIALHEWEAGKILSVVYPDGTNGRRRIEPAVHMPVIMQYLRKRAVRRWGPYFDNPRIRNSKKAEAIQAENTEQWDNAFAFELEDVLPAADMWLQSEWYDAAGAR